MIANSGIRLAVKTEKTMEFTQEEIKEANAQIAKLVAEAYAALETAEAVADKYNLVFDFDPAYGMGGYYDGADGEWNPSSQGC